MKTPRQWCPIHHSANCLRNGFRVWISTQNYLAIIDIKIQTYTIAQAPAEPPVCSKRRQQTIEPRGHVSINVQMWIEGFLGKPINGFSSSISIPYYLIKTCRLTYPLLIFVLPKRFIIYMFSSPWPISPSKTSPKVSDTNHCLKTSPSDCLREIKPPW